MPVRVCGCYVGIGVMVVPTMLCDCMCVYYVMCYMMCACTYMHEYVMLLHVMLRVMMCACWFLYCNVRCCVMVVLSRVFNVATVCLSVLHVICVYDITPNVHCTHCYMVGVM